MKKNVLAFFLAIAMVLCNMGTVPVLAAHTTVDELEVTNEEAAVAEEEITEVVDEETAETGNSETGAWEEDASLEKSTEVIEEESEQGLTDLAEKSEDSITEEESAEGVEKEEYADSAYTSTEMAEVEEPSVIEDKKETEAEKTANLADDYGSRTEGVLENGNTWRLSEDYKTLFIEGTSDVNIKNLYVIEYECRDIESIDTIYFGEGIKCIIIWTEDADYFNKVIHHYYIPASANEVVVSDWSNTGADVHFWGDYPSSYLKLEDITIFYPVNNTSWTDKGDSSSENWENCTNVTANTWEVPYPLDGNKLISDCSIRYDAPSFVYNGKERKLALDDYTISDGNWILKEGKDFLVTYNSNINAGNATVTFKGIGNYSGSIEKSYTIAKANLKLSTAFTNKKIAQSSSIQKLSLNATTSPKGATLSYKSNNKNVVVNKNGEIRINKNFAGSATITVTAKMTNYKTLTKKVIITVCKPKLEYTYFYNWCKGEKFKVKLLYAPKGKKITWTSSNKKIAEVSNKGVVKIKGVGTCTITVKCNGKKYTAKVKSVWQNPNFFAILSAYDTRNNCFVVRFKNRSNKGIEIISDGSYSMDVDYKSYDRKLKLANNKNIVIPAKKSKTVRFYVKGNNTWPDYHDHTVRYYFKFDGKKYLGSVWDEESSYKKSNGWYSTYWTEEEDNYLTWWQG